ncbi:MAG: KOW domain-containing RNA-binding protein [Lachnospiraceae bacterium]|nr:KOW domain-containing RNA-binding protein [Lachnospiraceae bacterium]
MRYENFSFCKSLAGHDKDCIYIIIKEEKNYVYVVDGKYKTLESPKRKNKKHIEWISSIYNVSDIGSDNLRNEDIRKAIKLYKKN